MVVVCELKRLVVEQKSATPQIRVRKDQSETDESAPKSSTIPPTTMSSAYADEKNAAGFGAVTVDFAPWRPRRQTYVDGHTLQAVTVEKAWGEYVLNDGALQWGSGEGCMC